LTRTNYVQSTMTYVSWDQNKLNFADEKSYEYELVLIPTFSAPG